MSGSGQASFRAPSALSAPTGDQPLTNTDGRPTFYMLQWMQRIQSYLGQPTDPPAGYYTVTEQLDNLAAEVAIATYMRQSGTSGSGASITGAEAIEAAAKAGLSAGAALPPSAGSIARYRAQIWYGNGQ